MGVDWRRLLAMGAVSAAGGTALNQIHVSFGVLVYPHGCFPGCSQACHVPFAMGGAGIALAMTHAFLRARFRQPPGGSLAAVLATSLLFAGAYLASGLFQATPIALLAGYLLVAAGAVAFDRRPARVVLVVVTAVLGGIAELVLTGVGAFAYVHPNVLGLPYWIAGLYAFAGFVGAALENRWPVIRAAP